MVGASLVLNVLGLAAGLIGTVLLFFFGLPPDINRHGHQSLILEQIDEAERAKGALFDRLGRIGMGLLFLAFLLQLGALFVRE